MYAGCFFKLFSLTRFKFDLDYVSIFTYHMHNFQLGYFQREAEDNIPVQAGNRTDAALLQYLFEFGVYYQTWRDDYPEDKLVRVFEFSPHRKCMTTVIADEEGGFKLYSKGASEVLLELCTSVVSKTGEPREFTKEDAENLFRDFIDPWQKEGLRILCLTTKNISSSGCFLVFFYRVETD